MNRVKYAFDTFKTLKCFDIVPHSTLLEMFNKVEKHCYFLNSNKWVDDIEDIPLRFRFTPEGGNSAVIKSDVHRMSMDYLGERWDSWIYFTIPHEFINKFQTRTLETRVVSIFRTFMQECIDKDLDWGNVTRLSDEYDEKYPDLYQTVSYTPFFPFWRYLMFVDQFNTIWRDGLVYPIVYNSTCNIFKRGSHRSLMIAGTGHDIPIFVQYPINAPDSWEIKINDGITDDNLVLVPNVKTKTLTFLKDGNEIYSTDSTRT